MVSAREQSLGTYRGTVADDQPVLISISKKGGSFYISDGQRRHLCHPSVRDLEGAKREAALVFQVRNLEPA